MTLSPDSVVQTVAAGPRHNKSRLPARRAQRSVGTLSPHPRDF